jgi:hypothetical protein
MKELNKFSAFLLYYVVISFLPRFLDIVHCHLSPSFLSPWSPQPWESFLSSGFSLAQGLLKSSLLSPRPPQPKPSPAQGLPSPMASQPNGFSAQGYADKVPKPRVASDHVLNPNSTQRGNILSRDNSAQELFSPGTN